MKKSRRVLSVFLASPGDVSDERAAAEEVVSRVNRIFGRLIDWEIDLHKWEDKTPGFGRPQQLINEMVDGCDLFVGLLWKRWGQPTGEYSSGFEEEFERARARRKEKGEPEVWLFFKAVDAESRNDPGVQLNKVLEFRKSQGDLREVLFQEVQHIEDWKNTLLEYLSQHLLKLHRSDEAAHSQSAAAVPILDTENAETELRPVTEGGDKPLRQLMDASTLLAQVVQSGNLEFFRDDPKRLSELDISRIYLLMATWMSRRYTREVLGTHEINLLYKNRDALELTSAEKHQLFRTIIGSGNDVVPGWYWFREDRPSEVAISLIALATLESNGIRARALETLTDSGIEIAKGAWRELPFNDESPAVRNQAYEYLVRIGDRDALSILDSLALTRSDIDEDEVRLTQLRLLARLDPPKALADAIAKNEYISETEIKILEKSFTSAGDELLLRGIKSPAERLRKLSLEELANRGRVPVQIATELTHDSSLILRATAFETLAKAGVLSNIEEVRKRLSQEDSQPAGETMPLSALMFGQPPPVKPDADSIIVTFYRTQSVAFLLEAADWYSLEGALAYRALMTDHYEQLSSRLRDDLGEGFGRIKRESVERQNSKYSSEVWQRVAPAFDKHDDFIKSNFTEGALRALAASGRPADVDLARPYLSDDHWSVRDAARGVICKLGSAEDLGELIKITTDAWGELRKAAAATALRVSPKPMEVAFELTNNSDSGVKGLAFNWLLSQDSEEVRAYFLNLLSDEDDTNLSLAHTKAIGRAPRPLSNQDNVLLRCRDLAPSPLREMFIKNLRQEARGSDDDNQ